MGFNNKIQQETQSHHLLLKKCGADALAFTITSSFSIYSAVSLAMEVNCKSCPISRTIRIPAIKSPSLFPSFHSLFPPDLGNTNEITHSHNLEVLIQQSVKQSVFCTESAQDDR